MIGNETKSTHLNEKVNQTANGGNTSFNETPATLAELLTPPLPARSPLTGTRTLEFTGYIPGKNQFNKPVIKFSFTDTFTGDSVYRTVNATYAPKSFLYMFLTWLLGEREVKQAQNNIGTVERLLKGKIGTRYRAECGPSRNGRFTDIHRILEEV